MYGDSVLSTVNYARGFVEVRRVRFFTTDKCVGGLQKFGEFVLTTAKHVGGLYSGTSL